ncbi:MAG: glycerophosphoryl diester phosphodiesterase [Gammaproteobacteria bacterium]|jgi:glycerophosphoryl diester phosphodiesterase
MKSIYDSIIPLKQRHPLVDVPTLAGIILFVYCCLLSFAYADETSMNHKVIIAHRGASGYLPEHTLASKTLAYEMEADYLEQDVVLTRDSIPIVLHDIQLDAVTNVRDIFPDRARKDRKYYAVDFDLHELKQLIVTGRKARAATYSFSDRFPKNSSKFRIATLEEEIQLIQGLNKSTNGNVGLYTELKSPAWHKTQGYDLTTIVLDTLARYGYQNADDNVFIQCFDPAELKRIRFEMNSKLKLVQLIGKNAWNEADTDYNVMRTPEGLKNIASYANGIGPSIDQILASRFGKVTVTELVNEAHKLNLVVHPYTLRKDALPNYASGFDELLELLFDQAGVDGVFTDFPDLAVQFKKQRNL